MLNFIDIYMFIPVSGCVGSGPSALIYTGAYNAVKTALITCISISVIWDFPLQFRCFYLE